VGNFLIFSIAILQGWTIAALYQLKKEVTIMAANDQQLTAIVGTVVTDVTTLLQNSQSADDPAVDQAISALTDLDAKIKAASSTSSTSSTTSEPASTSATS
jgi:hypothetical protein